VSTIGSGLSAAPSASTWRIKAQGNSYAALALRTQCSAKAREIEELVEGIQLARGQRCDRGGDPHAKTQAQRQPDSSHCLGPASLSA